MAHPTGRRRLREVTWPFFAAEMYRAMVAGAAKRAGGVGSGRELHPSLVRPPARPTAASRTPHNRPPHTHNRPPHAHNRPLHAHAARHGCVPDPGDKTLRQRRRPAPPPGIVPMCALGAVFFGTALAFFGTAIAFFGTALAFFGTA